MHETGVKLYRELLAKLNTALAQSAQPQESVEPCCGNYARCLRPCTPRGVWQGKRESQAIIDRLMLEYCPEEMPPEQTAEWASNQKKSAQQATAAVESDREHVSPAVADLDGLVKRLSDPYVSSTVDLDRREAAAAISQLRRERGELTHDIERHVAITAEQAQEIEELNQEVADANKRDQERIRKWSHSVAVQQERAFAAESSVAELEAKCKMVFEQRDGSVASVGDLCQMKERVEELTAKLAAAERCRDIARAELNNFIKAERFNKERFRDDTEFADWVQSRARFGHDRSALLPKAEKDKPCPT